MNAPAATPHLAAGTRLGRFAVVRVLGEGGMGVVYEARDPELDRAVALKVLRSHHGAAGSMRLLREAQALAQLAHPNVVAVYDVGVAEERVFIAMEFVDGATLDVRLRDRRVPWQEVLALYLQAGRGLAAAHARSIVHRDLKPGNLLVDGEGRVRVTDFGLARLARELDEPEAPPDLRVDSSSRMTIDEDERTVDPIEPTFMTPGPTPSPGLLEGRLTDAGSIVGTPRYMAPEQRAGLDATPASDQYAFCVALWEALFGEHPFAEGRAAARGAPRWLVRSLEKGLAADPRARHPSMTALLAGFERGLGRRRRLALAAVVAVAVGGTATAALAFGPGRDVDCGRAGAELDGVWGDAQRRAMIAAFTVARPYGAETAARIAARLDDYAGTWRRAHVDSCRATHERGEQSVELLDRRTACLESRLLVLRSLVPALAAAGGEVVDRAFEALGELAPVELCAAARLATARPVDPRSAPVYAELADVAVAFRLGRYAQATPVAAAALAQARTLGDAALTARALVEHARLVNTTDPRASRAELEEALGEAARGDDRATEATAALRLFRAAVEEGNRERIASLLPAARASVSAARVPSLEHELAGADARRLMKEVRPDEARAACDRVAALERPELPPRAVECRCSAALNAEDIPEGVRQCRLSLDERTRRFGDGHPETGAGLTNMAIALERQGDVAGAIAMNQRVLGIYEVAYGEGTKVVTVLLNLGRALNGAGRPAEARAHLERALAIVTRTSDRPSATLANVHGILGGVLAALGDTEGAVRHTGESLRMTEALVGPETRDVVQRLLDHGRAQMTDERALEAALATFRRGADLAARIGQTGDALRGLHVLFQASCLTELGKARQGLLLAEQGFALLTPDNTTAEERASGRAILDKARRLAR